MAFRENSLILDIHNRWASIGFYNQDTQTLVSLNSIRFEAKSRMTQAETEYEVRRSARRVLEKVLSQLPE